MRKISVFLFMILSTFLISTNVVHASSDFIKTDTKNKVIFINNDEGKMSYSWSFDKESYNQNDLDIDLNIKFDSDLKDEISKFIKTNTKVRYVSFNHHGSLPSSANIKVPVGDGFKDGDKLKLYYYDEENDKIELVNNSIDVINGYANFDIEHCSDYFLTMSIASNVASKKDNNGIVIIGMVIVIAVLIGYTIMKNK